VRARLPSATLELAGSGSEAFDDPAGGVRGLGRVPDAGEVLAGAAVLAFPCPPTSGPKVKVLEAMALGLPVVTTAAGVEGVAEPDGDATGAVTVAPEDPAGFADALASALADPAGRAAMAERARALVEAHHGPTACAERRVTAWAHALERR
jgi:glycosyltransferase involved in cell wall biosynthesis